MEEKVSDLQKMTRVKEDLAPKYLQLAHSLSVQSDPNWKKLKETLSYEHSIFAQPSQKMEENGKITTANMVFVTKTRGRDKTTKVSRVCRKPRHLAKDCWERNRKPGKNKGLNKRVN